MSFVPSEKLAKLRKTEEKMDFLSDKKLVSIGGSFIFFYNNIVIHL